MGDYDALGVLIVFFIVFFFIVFAFSIFYLVINYFFFKKTTGKGWPAIIPVYSQYVLVKEIAELDLIWFVILLVVPFLGSFITSFSNAIGIDGLYYFGNIISLCSSVISIVIATNIYYNITKKFHLEGYWIVLLVLLNPIALAILAFSKKYQYDKSVPVSKHGFFKPDAGPVNATNNNVQSPIAAKPNFCERCGHPLENGICPDCSRSE